MQADNVQMKIGHRNKGETHRNIESRLDNIKERRDPVICSSWSLLGLLHGPLKLLHGWQERKLSIDKISGKSQERDSWHDWISAWCSCNKLERRDWDAGAWKYACINAWGVAWNCAMADWNTSFALTKTVRALHKRHIEMIEWGWLRAWCYYIADEWKDESWAFFNIYCCLPTSLLWSQLWLSSVGSLYVCEHLPKSTTRQSR